MATRWRLPTLAEFQRDRAAGALPDGAVTFGARSGAVLSEGRAAGVAAVARYTEAAPRWGGEPASFTGDQWGGAYWLLGTDLFVSSGARLYVDLRAELSQPAASAALARVPAMQWAAAMTGDLSTRARAFLAERGVPFTPPAAAADVVNREWLRLAIWYTYHRDLTNRVDAVRMARDLLVPAFGATLGTPDAATGMFRGFVIDATNRDGFEPNDRVFLGPFPGQVVRGPEIDVGTGGGNGGGGGSSSSSGEGMGALFALAGLALIAGEDK